MGIYVSAPIFIHSKSMLGKCAIKYMVTSSTVSVASASFPPIISGHISKMASRRGERLHIRRLLSSATIILWSPEIAHGTWTEIDSIYVILQGMNHKICLYRYVYMSVASPMSLWFLWWPQTSMAMVSQLLQCYSCLLSFVVCILFG